MKGDGSVQINKYHVELSTECDETKEVDPHLQIMSLLLMEDRVNIFSQQS
jgi:hypothetical protein